MLQLSCCLPLTARSVPVHCPGGAEQDVTHEKQMQPGLGRAHVVLSAIFGGKKKNLGRNYMLFLNSLSPEVAVWGQAKDSSGGGERLARKGNKQKEFS